MPHPWTESSRFTFTAAAGHDFSVSSLSGTEEVPEPCGFEIEPVHETADIDIPVQAFTAKGLFMPCAGNAGICQASGRMTKSGRTGGNHA